MKGDKSAVEALKDLDYLHKKGGVVTPGKITFPKRRKRA